MGDPEPGTAEKTGEAVLNREERIRGFIELLKSPHLHYRWKAAEALGEIGDVSAVIPLIEALRDPYVDVQWIAAQSLGKIGDPRAVEPLIAALKSEEKWLRIGAAWGLGRLGSRGGSAAVPFLIELLNDPKRDVRKTASWALGRIGDERAIEPLKRAEQDPDAVVRDEARTALREIEGKTMKEMKKDIPRAPGSQKPDAT
jgi:HEAT repeat protein